MPKSIVSAKCSKDLLSLIELKTAVEIMSNRSSHLDYLPVNFLVRSDMIEVEVCGLVSVSYQYRFNPKTEKEILKNADFIERYISRCENQDQLKKQLGIQNN